MEGLSHEPPSEIVEVLRGKCQGLRNDEVNKDTNPWPSCQMDFKTNGWYFSGGAKLPSKQSHQVSNTTYYWRLLSHRSNSIHTTNIYKPGKVKGSFDPVLLFGFSINLKHLWLEVGLTTSRVKEKQLVPRARPV